MKRTIRKYGMIERNDRIAIGVSGGKDSITLMYLLKKITENRPNIELIVVTIDEGIKGYRNESIPIAQKNAKELEIEHKIVSFKEIIGYGLDELLQVAETKVVKTKRKRLRACAYCGVFRRSILNKMARELGASKVATGHNLDDDIQAILMNLMRADIEKESRLGPKTEPRHSKLVARIKPLREVPEREVALYALLNGIEVHLEECPYAGESFRQVIRNWLNETEVKYPGTKFSILRGFDKLLPILKERFGHPVLNNCSMCGEPTQYKVCKACELLRGLNI